MKKTSFFLLAIGATMMATSCSNDIDLDAPGINGDGNVTLSVKLPGQLNTRAYGDGLTAQTLRYVVYEEGSTTAIYPAGEYDNPVRTAKFDPTSLSTGISLQLVNGKAYDIIFWADNDAAAYTLDARTQTVTVNYGAVNDENRDAFYGKYSTGKISGPITDDVTLVRPFAQVNLGTDDLGAAEVKRVFGENAENLQTSVKTRAYTTLNLFDGTTGGEQEVTLTQAAIPTGDDAIFPFNPYAPEANPYQRIQMHYLLVPGEGSVADFEFRTHIGNGAALPNSVQVTNVPLQANYRTNIYGSILTNPVNITVTKDAEWILPDYEVGIWNGGNLATLNAMIAKGGNVAIASDVASLDLSGYAGEQPLNLSIQAKVGSITLGATAQPVIINVAKDVEYPAFKNPAGTAIGNFTIAGDINTTKPLKNFTIVKSADNVTFKNVRFDGEGTQSHGIQEYGMAISNFTLSGCTFENYVDAAIWMSSDKSGKRNVTVENCKVTVPSNASSTTNGIYLLGFEDVTVKDCQVTSPIYHGIFVRGSKSMTVTGCTVTGAPQDGIKAEGQLGATVINICNNTLQAKGNGIRVKNPVAAETLTINGNTIDMSQANPYNASDDEPWGILIQSSSAQTSTPVVTVKDNVKGSTGNYWFKNQLSSIASTSNTANPFK